MMLGEQVVCLDVGDMFVGNVVGWYWCILYYNVIYMIWLMYYNYVFFDNLCI